MFTFTGRGIPMASATEKWYLQHRGNHVNQKPTFLGTLARCCLRRSRLNNTLLLLCLVLLLLAWILLTSSSSFTSSVSLSAMSLVQVFMNSRQMSLYHKSNEDYGSQSDQAATDKQTTCKFPQLLVNDPALVQHLRNVSRIVCNGKPDLVYVQNGTLQFSATANQNGANQNSVSQKAANIDDNINCVVMPFSRGQDDHDVVMGKSTAVKVGMKLESDFFKLECRDAEGAKRTNIVAGIKPIDIKSRLELLSKSDDRLKHMNVYMFGLDSLSRMMFMRKLPKLYSYLTNKLGAVVLEGYNIVGDGTPQALIPILTGKTEVELPLTRKRYANASYVNIYPWVWNNFRNAGYVTMYAEDTANIGTFTYRLKGFKEQPTDHLMRTYYLEAERLSEYGRCLGATPQHVHHFRYSEHFFEAYPNIPKFALSFHGTLSHDDLNLVQGADEDFTNHIDYLNQNGYLNNTMLIAFADHGHRFAEIRETQQGKMEERLPFFSITMPNWFRRAYPEAMRALQSNSKRLTTPFDIHPTLLSILNFGQHHGDEKPRDQQTGGQQPGGQQSKAKYRGLSLFQEVPADRTCADADIEPHWCTCLAWNNVSNQDATVKRVAQSLVDAINAETSRERALCAPLKLSSIVRSFRYRPEQGLLQYKKNADVDGFVGDFSDQTAISQEVYQVNIITVPGNALFEASLTVYPASGNISVDLNVVSHINKYGDMPHCIIDKDYFLIKYCVCYDKIKQNLPT